MRNLALTRIPTRPRRALAAIAAALASLALPMAMLAQSPESTAYAVTELNLRKGPGSSDAIFAVIPTGAELIRSSDETTNDYVPVSYNGINGWAIDLGLVATPEDLALALEGGAAPESSLDLYQSDIRVTLTPLMLRSEPDLVGEPIVGMPEGSTVVLTREGYENGYVTVDYGGARGWAYAELLGEGTR